MTNDEGGTHRAPPGDSFQIRFVSGALRRGYGHAIRRHNLRLVGENLATLWIDSHFQPVIIVGAVFLVIAECFHTRKVFQPLALRGEERPIDAEVMRVSMHVGNRPLERRHFCS